MSLEAVNYLLALATVVAQALTIVVLFGYALRDRSVYAREIYSFVAAYGVAFALALASIASAITVYYSGILGIAPCPLCWWQRAFLYPQVVLFFVALVKRETQVAYYSIALSAVGATIAMYQHFLQMLPGTGLPCPAAASSCAQRILFEFGYITYPLMAFSLFALLIVMMLCVQKR